MRLDLLARFFFCKQKMAKCHRSINLSTKIALIEAVETGKETKSKIAESFGLPKSTVSTILKNKVKLREVHESAKFDPGKKRFRQPL